RILSCAIFFFFSCRRRHTRSKRDWSSDVCSSDLRPRAIVHHAKTNVGDLENALARRVHVNIAWLGETTCRDATDRLFQHLFSFRSEERRVGKESYRWL